MGKPRVLAYPPPCPTCGEEFTYSKAPYCSCLCGAFVYEDGVLRPAKYHDRSKGKKGTRKTTQGSAKQFVPTVSASWYEKMQGWLGFEGEYEDEEEVDDEE
jgi:hypothetical protein